MRSVWLVCAAALLMFMVVAVASAGTSHARTHTHPHVAHASTLERALLAVFASFRATLGRLRECAAAARVPLHALCCSSTRRAPTATTSLWCTLLLFVRTHTLSHSLSEEQPAETPLMVAILQDNDARVRELLNTGASPAEKITGGWTPLHAASSKGIVDWVRLLIDHGGEVNAKNVDNRTRTCFLSSSLVVVAALAPGCLLASAGVHSAARGCPRGPRRYGRGLAVCWCRPQHPGQQGRYAAACRQCSWYAADKCCSRVRERPRFCIFVLVC